MAKAKRISGLDCSAPADKMVRLVLRAQLKAMCGLQDKALDWKDPEGVHDMRVLSRRLRSAVSDLRPYLGKASLPPIKLKAIANSLGDVRDEDVALMALERIGVHCAGVYDGSFNEWSADPERPVDYGSAVPRTRL